MSNVIGNRQRSADIGAESTVYPILFTISFAHLLNDLVQSVIPAVYPLLKDNYQLSFTQIGLITFTFQATASLLQPFVGYFTDKKPQPFSLAIGMGFSLLGLLVLASAASFWIILCAVALVGMGSSVFHPESSRVAYLASGGRRGFAQSVFQIGGNVGSAIGPLLVALVVMPYGQGNVRWFALGALLAIVALSRIGLWYRTNLSQRTASAGKAAAILSHGLSKGRLNSSIAILLVLIFSKYFYMACMTSYFTFFLIEKFEVSVATSQIYLFVFLAAIAAGTYLGGPLGDKYGRKYIIWASILGSAPFTLLLPHVGLPWVICLSVLIGVVLASAFSAILVYAQELLPGRIGMISGLFFGFAFGMGGLGSALLGKLADLTDIQYVFWICSFLPLLGLVTWLLPNLGTKRSG